MFNKKDRQKLVAAGLPKHVTSQHLQTIRNTKLWNALCSLYGSEPLLRRLNGEDNAKEQSAQTEVK
jgi:hypothetical protein